MQALHPAQTIRPLDTAKPDCWLQVMSQVDPRFGGIASSVPALSRATEAQGGHDCPIAGFCDELEHSTHAHGVKEEPLRVKYFSAKRFRWTVDHNLRRRLRETIRAAQGVHIHGVWEPHCAIAAAAARACRRPYIISAHGMLEQWALGQKRLKKALYAALVEARNLQRADCLRALTPDEVNDYRRVGLNNPIAIVPGGVEAPLGATSDLFFEMFPQLAGKRIVLFLGRVHHKKGLHLLLEAWSHLAKKADDVQVVIAGPHFDGTLHTLQEMAARMGIEKSVTFAGMLKGEQKWSALRAASLFVLPSYSEGFSVAVLEAMAMGLPVVVTTPCHIPDVLERQCGWVIEPDAAQLQRALDEFLECSAETAGAIGARGRELVERKFCWPVVGKQMAEVYDWLRGGPKPAHVVTA